MANFDFVEVDSYKIHNTLLNNLMDSINEPLYPGDERRIFGEALAYVLTSVYNDLNDTAKQKMLDYARDGVLDALGARVTTARLEPQAAHDIFRFTLSAPQDANVIIPKGTRMTPDGVAYFATDAAAVIQAGTTHVDTMAHCTEGGADFNGFGIGTITTLVDQITYVASVTNLKGTTGGNDGEPYTEEGDNRYRERIRLAPAKLSVGGSEPAYRYFALSADPQIKDVKLDNPQGNHIDVYVLMDGGELPDQETLKKVQDILNGDTIRLMSDVVTAKAPTAVLYDIELRYYCPPGMEAEAIETVEADGGAIDQFNEGQMQELGKDINPDDLRRFILAPSSGSQSVTRVDVIKPVFTTVNEKQVAKFSGNLTISHAVTAR